MKHEDKVLIVEIWKSVVEVQRHFNDISMRIRSLFVTILLALFASVGFLLDKKFGVQLLGVKIQFMTIVPIIGCLGTYLFYFIDRYWYHRLLVGSVKHAIAIEKKYEKDLPEISLSEAIGKESPYNPRYFIRWIANLVVSDEKYKETGRLHSDGKIELFYKSVILLLFVVTLLLALFGGVSVECDRGTKNLTLGYCEIREHWHQEKHYPARNPRKQYTWSFGENLTDQSSALNSARLEFVRQHECSNLENAFKTPFRVV